MDAAQLKAITSILGPAAAVVGGLAAGMGLLFLLDQGNGSLNASFLESGSASNA
ncbi:hypothetical protein [Tomitella biformata]|uniref:hypothetical protein n=1 Tax=Tomitella biformata TaxID=630403 RepID=UPI0004BB0B26|nr:hypothetical protein [Tomitella biformata]